VLERLGQHPGVVAVDADQPCADEGERLYGGEVRGSLDEDDVARVDERGRHQVQALLRAARDLDLRRRRGEVTRQPQRGLLAELRLADRRRVLQRARPLVLEHVRERLPEVGELEQLRVGDAARERDDVAAAQHGEDVPHRRGLHGRETRGQPEDVFSHERDRFTSETPGPYESRDRRASSSGAGSPSSDAYQGWDAYSDARTPVRHWMAAVRGEHRQGLPRTRRTT
jgi:hypothetical protein